MGHIPSILITNATSADQPKWDHFVHNHPCASPYHLFAWGEAITKAYGHKPYYLMAKQKNELVGILPLIHLRLPFLSNQLAALPFCDIGNCLANNNAIQETLLQEALDLANQFKCRNIQFRGRLQYEDDPTIPVTNIEHSKVRMLLNLPESSETLLQGFKSKLRSQIRKAEKNGVQFRWTGKEGVHAFYSVFSKNMRDLGSPVHSKKLFQAVLEKFGNNSRIGLAEYHGKCIGVGLILSTEKQTCIPWASTLQGFNKLAPNMLLYWNCLKYAADNNKNIFDFGRSTEDEGTYRFKKQWGAKPVPLKWYSFSPRPTPHKSNNKKTSQREQLANIWKTIPVPIANLIGPQFRKYITL